MHKWLLVSLVLLTVGAWAAGWTDLAGRPSDPLHDRGEKAAVLFFVCTECAGSDRMSPEWNRICQAYAARSIGFYVVQEDDDSLTTAAAREHATAFGYTCPVLMDPHHSLAHVTGITVTPEVAVVDAQAHLLYHGRLDDRLLSCSEGRAATTHDLRDALDAVLAGRPVAHAFQPAVGCALP